MNPGEDAKTGRHALVWIAFSVVAVATHGPVWEENYEFAQVFTGQIRYPTAHPLNLHAHNLYSLQLHAAALQLWWGAGPEWVCGVRNVLYLLAKTLPFFFLGAWLSQRVIAGHAAALTALLAAGDGFTHVYPTSVWPIVTGNGVIGTGAAILTVAALATGRHGLGFALAAAMPAIHLGQFPPVSLLCAAIFLLAAFQRNLPDLRRMVLGAAAGSSLTLASAYVAWSAHIVYVPEPPYVSGMDFESIWHGWLKHHTDHQRLAFGKDQVMMLWSLWLLGACAWHERRSRMPSSAHARLLLYAFLVCEIVWTCMLIHAILRENTPRLVLAWIPYRLANHLPPLLASVLAVRLLSASNPLWTLALTLTLTFPFFGLSAESTLTFLSALGLILVAGQIRPAWAAIAWTLLGFCGWYVLLGLLYLPRSPLLTGLLLGGLIQIAPFVRVKCWMPEKARGHIGRAALAAAIAATIFLRPHAEAIDSNLIQHSPFDAAVRDLELAGELRPNEMICVPYLQRTLQGRLQHPVMADFATLSWLPYQPEISPALYVMYKDLYGLDLAPEAGAPGAANMLTLWKERSSAEWRNLGKKYGFRYIVVPDFLDLDAELIISAGHFKLYKVTPS